MTHSDDENVERRRAVPFAEAVGKTVASIRLNETPDGRALEVRFTDGTFFWFELIPGIALEVRYMNQRDGDLEIIRDYGSLSERISS
jgi:hypothetical protein